MTNTLVAQNSIFRKVSRVLLAVSLLLASGTFCLWADPPPGISHSLDDEIGPTPAKDKAQKIADDYIEQKGVDPTSPAGQVVKPYVVGTTVVDHAGTFRYGYDARDHRTRVIDASGGTTRYEYDTSSGTVKITGSSGETRLIDTGRDGLLNSDDDRLIEMTHPDGSTTEYDSAGRLIRTTDAAGNTATYRYEPMDDEVGPIPAKDEAPKTADDYIEKKGVDPTSPAGQVIKPYVVGTTIIDDTYRAGVSAGTGDTPRITDDIGSSQAARDAYNRTIGNPVWRASKSTEELKQLLAEYRRWLAELESIYATHFFGPEGALRPGAAANRADLKLHYVLVQILEVEISVREGLQGIGPRGETGPLAPGASGAAAGIGAGAGTAAQSSTPGAWVEDHVETYTPPEGAPVIGEATSPEPIILDMEQNLKDTDLHFESDVGTFTNNPIFLEPRIDVGTSSSLEASPAATEASSSSGSLSTDSTPIDPASCGH